MIHKFPVRLACTAALLLAPTTLAAKDDDDRITLAPASKWSLEYADEKCRLARAFGNGDELHVLFFEQDGPAHYVGMSAGGPAMTRLKRFEDVDVQFGADAKKIEKWHYKGSLDGIGDAIIYSSIVPGKSKIDEEDERGDNVATPDGSYELPSVDTEGLKHADTIVLSRKSRSVTFETGNLVQPFEALNECARDLVRHWGVDVERHTQMTRRAEWTNAEKIVRRIQKHYPSTALRDGEQGVLRLRVMIDETGAVTECHLGEVTQVEDLQPRVCKDMARAKFRPALDKDGQPMASYIITRISYIMP